MQCLNIKKHDIHCIHRLEWGSWATAQRAHAKDATVNDYTCTFKQLMQTFCMCMYKWPRICLRLSLSKSVLSLLTF